MGCSAHAKSCFFLFGVYLCPVGGAPHTPNLAFSFLACICALSGGAPHTPNLAFFFLACICALLEVLRTRQVLLFLFWRVFVPCWGCSAHAKSCFFFFGVYLCPVGVLHTRQILLFLFWRVPALFDFVSKPAMVAPPRSARRHIVGAIRDKNFVLVSTSSLIP